MNRASFWAALGVALISYGTLAIAADPNQDGKDFANSLTGKVNSSANIDPNTVPNYQGANVPETQLYGAGGSIEGKAMEEAATNETAQFVVDAHYERPAFDIDKQSDPLFINEQEIVDKSNSLSETYQGCVDLPVSGVPGEEEFQYCSVSGKQNKETITCETEQEVTVRDYPLPPVEIYKVPYRIYSIDTSGDHEWCHIEVSDPYSGKFKINSIVVKGIWQQWCKDQWRSKLLKHTKFLNGWATNVGPVQDVRFPNWGYKTTFNVYVQPTRQPPEFTFNWPDYECSDMTVLQSSKTHTVDGPNCIESGTRIIQGEHDTHEVYQECWKYEIKHEYTSVSFAENSNECQALEDEGCGLVQSVCEEEIGGLCVKRTQKYQCGGNDGDRTVSLCGEQLVCEGGDCTEEYKTQHDASNDFKLAATNMAVANEIAKEFDFDTLNIFTGDDKTCKKHDFGYSDCCKDGGWGTDIGTSQCSTEEKELGIAKEAEKVHYVGSYDSGSWPDERTYKVYCVYPSKLARIIIEQGNKQLGRNYGTPKSPNCLGFSLVELESLDFELMDLSEFYSDVQAKADSATLPDTQQVTEELRQKIEAMQGQ